MELYARAVRQRQQAVQTLDATNCELAAVWSQSRAAIVAGCWVSDLLAAHAYGQDLDKQRKAREATLKAAERQADDSFNELLEARRRRETVEKHSQRDRMRYDRACVHADQKAMDELAGARTARAVAWKTAEAA